MKVIDSNRFYLPGTGTEFLHLASVEDGFREYICFYQKEKHQIYVEELTGGVLKKIDNEQQWLDVYLFLIHSKALVEPFTPHAQPKISISVPGKRLKTS